MAGRSTPPLEGSGIVPEILHIDCTVNLGCTLDLKEIVSRAKSLKDCTTEYNPNRSAAVIMSIDDLETTAWIYNSGKMVCRRDRAVSNKQARMAAWKCSQIIKKMGFDVQFEGFKILDKVAICDVKFEIRLDVLHLLYNNETTYEPEVDPGLTYRMEKPKVVLSISVSGKVVLKGAKVQQEIDEAFESIYPILKRFEKQPLLVMGLLNANSINANSVEINEIIHNHQCDILAITETWLKEDSSDTTKLCPPGFSFTHVPRSSRKVKVRGGVGILFRNKFSYKILKRESDMVEVLCVQFSLPHSNSPHKFNVWVIYAPPETSRRELFKKTEKDYYNQLETLFKEAALGFDTPTVIVGDFNIPFEPEKKSRFNKLFEQFHLLQRVHSPTHKTQKYTRTSETGVKETLQTKENILDLVIHHHRDQLVDAVDVFSTDDCFDHKLVKLILKLPS